MTKIKKGANISKWMMLLTTELNNRGIGCVFTLIVCRRIPKFDDVVTARSYHICNVLTLASISGYKVCCNEGTTGDAGLARRYTLDELTILGIVDFETLRITLHHN